MSKEPDHKVHTLPPDFWTKWDAEHSNDNDKPKKEAKK